MPLLSLPPLPPVVATPLHALPVPLPIPTFGVKVGYAQGKTSRLFVGADATIPLPGIGFTPRVDADGWTSTSHLFGDDSGYALSLCAYNPLALGAYYGYGPSVVHYDRDGDRHTVIGGKLFAGTHIPLMGLTVEGDLILASGATVGAITIGKRF